MPIFLTLAGLYIVIGLIVTGVGVYRAFKKDRHEQEKA